MNSNKNTSDKKYTPRYTLRTVTPKVYDTAQSLSKKRVIKADPCIRAACEDDDGYDPFSDRLPKSEPTFQEDPWR